MDYISLFVFGCFAAFIGLFNCFVVLRYVEPADDDNLDDDEEEEDYDWLDVDYDWDDEECW